MLKAIDLFAGCGGFSCGFERAGFHIQTAVEFDPTIAKTYALNHPEVNLLVSDIAKVDNQRYFHKKDADLIIGGPPCQGFSMAGARIRHNFVDDPRNYLFKHYVNVVRIVRPRVFIFENVKGILHYQQGKVFENIEKTFEDIGYKLQYFVVCAKDFGVPQARERTILIGSTFNFSLEQEILRTKQEIKKSNPHFFDTPTVWDAIGNLPKPTTTGLITAPLAKTMYQKELKGKSKSVSNHVATCHKDNIITRMRKIAPKQNFRVLNENIKSIHSGSYGRLESKGIAATITTRFDTPSGGKFIHPIENRTITPREAARLQSFPDDFKFLGNKSSVCRQIGNAVPPKLAYFFGVMLRRLLHDKR